MEFTVYSFCDGTPMGQGPILPPWTPPASYGEPGGCTQTPQPAYKKGGALFKKFANERCGYAELDEHVPFSCASPGSNTGNQQNFTGGPAIALAIDVAQPAPGTSIRKVIFTETMELLVGFLMTADKKLFF